MRFFNSVTAVLLTALCVTAHPSSLPETHNFDFDDDLELHPGVKIEYGTDEVKALALKLYPDMTEDESDTAFKVEYGAAAIIGYYALLDQGQVVAAAIRACKDQTGTGGTLKCINAAAVTLLGYAFVGFVGATHPQTTMTAIIGSKAATYVAEGQRPPTTTGLERRQSNQCPGYDVIYGHPAEEFSDSTGMKITAINDCGYRITQTMLSDWEGLMAPMIRLMYYNKAWAVQASFCTATSNHQEYQVDVHSSFEITTDVTGCEDKVSGQSVCTAAYN